MKQSGIDANESETHRSSRPMRRIHLQHYALAILSVAVALGASLVLEHFHFRVPSALLLLFAVAISSWYAGAGPAVLAAILSTISFYWYFVEPVHTIYIYRSQIPYFVIFTAFAALLSRFGTFRQRAEADLRRTHDQLKVERPKLGSRTIALLYFAFSSCWILFTDRLVHGLGLSNAYLLKVSEAKGILFISLSTLLMYVLVEKALRQRHSVATAYWQLVETAQEGVWSVDAEGKTVFANENMAAILGTSPGEMIGKSILPFVPQEKKDELLNHLLQREQGLQEHYEFPFLRADGAQVWTLLRVSPVLRDGQHSGCLALVSDITKRKHAEEALRRLNRELRAISNCNQALLRATDEQSLLEEICRIVCEEAGYRMAWVSYAEHDEAKSVRPVAWTGAEEGYLASAGITWADTDRGRSPTGTAIRSGKSCCIQDFAKDPRLAPWREGLLQRGFRSGIALPLKDENDNAFGSLTIHSAQPNAFTSEEVRLLEELAGDLAFGIVTLRSRAARKQAEQALRQSEAYLAEAQRLSHTGSWALDASTREYSYWSDEMFRIFGADPDGGIPIRETMGRRIHPEDVSRAFAGFEKSLREKVDTSDEYRFVLPDGKVKDIQSIRHPVLNDAGDVVQLVGTFVDITERKRTEEAQRRLADQLRLSFDAIIVWQLNGTIESWNRGAEQLYGYSESEALGRVTHELLKTAHPVPWPEIEARLRESGNWEGELRHTTKEGQELTVSAQLQLIVGTDGVERVLEINRDITDRKRAEEKLRQSEGELRQLVDVIPQQVFVFDADWSPVFANRRELEYTGLTSQETQSKDAVARIFHPEDLTKLEVARERARSDSAPFEVEARIRGKDGEYRWFLIRDNPLRDEQGRIIRWYGTRTDIEDRKRAEESLRQSEADLRQILEVSPQHVAVLAPDGSHLYLNQAGLEYHGFTLEQWQSCDLRKLFHPDDWERVYREAQNTLSSGSTLEIEARLLRRDRKYCWFFFRYKPLRDGQGRITRWIVAAIDIDERKQAEERLRHENVALREEIDKTSMFEEIVGASAVLQAVLSRVSKVAPTDSTVLITGETGTGKELVARAIHRRSHRSSCAFVSASCAVIPRDLIASELFGHEKGAFTGATQRHMGRFELAEGGTIFLDEVGELPAETQIALLRVLQEHEFERVGGTRSIQTNVRVIGATNRDLQAATEAGTFRSDLFYRLNVFPIEIPPLRERREDIPLLVEYFINRFAKRAGKRIRGVSKKTLDLFQSYPWPGNIRELQNIIERSVILCETEIFSVDESWLSRQPLAAEPKSSLDLTEKLAAQEKELIEAALRQCGGRVFGPSGAAARLGMPRSTLESKIRSLKINKDRFKSAASSKND